MAIAVIEKTFQVLETLARFDKPVPLVRLATSAELPKPTAYRILQSLATLGYVAQEERSGHYFATGRLGELAARDPHVGLKDFAQPLMEQLHARFNETVNLGVLDGSRVRYVSVIETTQPLRWVVRPGRSDPFYCTALGRAIGAFLPEERRERLLDEIRPGKAGDGTMTDRRKLEKIFKQTRRRGWAIEEEETADGVACVAMPLAACGGADAAISISIPASRFTRSLRRRVVEEFCRLVREHGH